RRSFSTAAVLEVVDATAVEFAGWTTIGAGDWDFAIPANARAINSAVIEFRIMVIISVLAAVVCVFHLRGS
ncbi:MAG TPA: hypothetical protein VEP30_06930, partial [Chthoniobacterales bacterium]|nr:hypothetical protein [Chthoniobacterales bacterium]